MHALHTLRTRAAHALHSRAGSQPARLRGQPLARLTQLMRGHAGTSLRQIKCTLGTALPRRAPPLSLSRVTLRLHCTRRLATRGGLASAVERRARRRAAKAAFSCAANANPPARAPGCRSPSASRRAVFSGRRSAAPRSRPLRQASAAPAGRWSLRRPERCLRTVKRQRMIEEREEVSAGQ